MQALFGEKPTRKKPGSGEITKAGFDDKKNDGENKKTLDRQKLLTLYTYSPWTVHGLSMDCPWTVHGQTMDSPHGLSMDLSMDSPWTVDGQSMDCTVHGQSMDGPWTVHGLSMDCP